MTNDNQKPAAVVTTRDGTRLTYRLLRGAGKGHCVLIHSLAMDASFWSRVADRLREDGDVLLYDCRGHGQSDKPKGPYSVELFADDLADLLATVGWTTAMVAGASMGGCIALAFAAAYPEKLTGLGLVDTTAWYGATAPRDWEERARKSVDEGLGSLVGFQATRWFSDGFREAHPEILEEAMSVFLANDVSAYAETCRMLGRCDKRDALPHIKVPTRIMVGAEDYATPVAMAEATQAAIPKATLEVIPGVRHLTPLECPDIVAHSLRGILVQAVEGK
jgi:3-oxoadipate enol-lactonase